MNNKEGICTTAGGFNLIIFPNSRTPQSQDNHRVEDSNIECSLGRIFENPVQEKYYTIGRQLGLCPQTDPKQTIPEAHRKRKRIFSIIRMTHEMLVASYIGIRQVCDETWTNEITDLDELIKFANEARVFKRGANVPDLSTSVVGMAQTVYPDIELPPNSEMVTCAGIAGLGVTRSVCPSTYREFSFIQEAMGRIQRDPLSSKLLKDYPEIFDATKILSGESARDNLGNKFPEYWPDIVK